MCVCDDDDDDDDDDNDDVTLVGWFAESETGYEETDEELFELRADDPLSARVCW